MIRVTITRNPKGEFSRIVIDGHAGYADYGQDIVCAGVSALAQTCALGLKKVVGINPRVRCESGFFSLELPTSLSGSSFEKSVCIVETLCIGLEDMAKSYPSHIRVQTIKEVL
jgi:uncharacterized protein YsxB (DUF464 family)